MNILFLTRRFYPHVGGVEKHIKNISRNLIERGVAVTVITEKENKTEKNYEIRNQTKIYRIPITFSKKMKKFQIWFWLLRNRQLIKIADIVHIHDVGFWFLPFKLLYPRKAVFITFHGYEKNCSFSLKAKIIRKINEKITKGNICIGKYLSKWYGIKTNFISYGAAKIKNKNRKICYDACFIGRIERDAGILTYLEALKILKKDGINLKIVICGSGDLNQKVKKFVKKNQLDVKFTGVVINPDKYLLQSRFSFASQYLAIIEAAQAKKLIFATYATKMKKDYIGFHPLKNSIIITNNPKILAKKIKYFLKNPNKKQKLIKSSFDWAKRQTWNNLTNKYMALWNPSLSLSQKRRGEGKRFLVGENHSANH